MEIRKPKFELGQKVIDKDGNVITVIKFNSYHFDENEYWYDVSYDGEKRIKAESFLEPYIEKPKTIWDLKKDDTYYLIDIDGEVMNATWNNMYIDNDFRKIGNIFLTKEEAEFEVERRKIETEMLRLGGRRTFKKGENNYCIVCYFDSHYDIWIYNNKSNDFGIGTIYFGSDNEAYNAIDSIGKDRIKKYIFGVES